MKRSSYQSARPRSRRALARAVCHISHYLTHAFAPDGERLRALTHYLRCVPDLVPQAQERLAGPLTATALATARWAYHRLLAFYREQAPDLGLALTTPEGSDEGSQRHTIARPRSADQAAYLAALAGAEAALEQFIGWLDARGAEATPSVASSTNGAMGAETLTTMLRVCLRESGSFASLLAQGEADLAQNRQRASEIAERLGGVTSEKQGAAALFASLDDWAPGRLTCARLAVIEQGALATAQTTIAELRAFVNERDLLPPAFVEGACQVAFQPPFLASPFALLDAPGAFERDDLPAWFYLPRAPLSVVRRAVHGAQPARRAAADWRRGWLSRMSPWALRDTAAHETVPGHYAFYRALRSIPSLAARAFRNYATFEGWAHYAEELMVEQGYGADDPRNALATRRAAIHRDCRYLVSLRLHAGDLTFDEATRFIMEQTGMARSLASGEARRCLADPACVGYTLGKLRLLRLREDYARQEGACYTLRGFHEAVLGSSPKLSVN